MSTNPDKRDVSRRDVNRSHAVLHWFCAVLIVGLHTGCERRAAKVEPTEIPKESKGRSRIQLDTTANTPISQPSTEPAANGSVVGKHDLAGMSPEQQLRAVDELAANGSSMSIEILATFIKGLPPGDFREDVVRRACLVSNPEAVTTALAMLQSSDDPGVIRMSQEIFARFADVDTIQSVVDIYDASSSANLRGLLERTVAQISSENAVPVLKLLLSDNGTPASDGMIQASAQALRKIGTAPAVDSLIERLNTEQNDDGRSLIAAEINEVRSPTAEASLQSAALGRSKFANEPLTRLTAIGVLLYYPSGETQDLLSSLASDADPQIASAAKGTLAEIRKRLGK